MALVDNLVEKGALKTALLIKAFREVDRADFIPDDLKSSAYADEPLPIGEGQTISQPWTVAFMLELLGPEPGENIMEIGYGSGWQTALLASLGANVWAIEIIPELCKFGKKNFEKFFKNAAAHFFCQDGSLGLPEIAKKIGGFDKIIAAASASGKIPASWKEQLKVGGKIVAPAGESIFEFIKEKSGSFAEKEYRGFAFVPLVSKGPGKA